MQRVTRSTVIDAPIERVWAVLRDFNSHDQWHSAVASSQILGSDRSDQVGCVRSFTLADGNRIQEQLLSLDDREHLSTYCIVQSTVPLQRYVATVTLKPVTDGRRTFWHWTSTFDTPRGRERELRDLVAQGVYQAGFDNLRQYLQAGLDVQGPAGQLVRQSMGVALPTKRMVQRDYGDATTLQMEDAQALPPGPNEVRIQQRAVGVNYLDIYLRRGWVPGMLPLPGCLGMEAAGRVIDVGSAVSDLMPGDRVAYLGPVPGAYCSVRTVPVDWVVRLPAAVEDSTAVATLLKGCTADLLLRDLGHVGPGTRVLVHAAAGGLGLMLCAWASRLGATVIGTVSSVAKAQIAREHGCEHTIVTQDYRFAEQVQRLGGAQLLIDGLGAAAARENLAALARRGHWVNIGQATGALPDLASDQLSERSITLSRPVVFDFVDSRAALSERAQRVWAALDDGSLRKPTIESHSLESAPAAHRRLESRASVGSLVLVP